MEEILHQLIGGLSHYLQGFIHPRWCKISAINSTISTESIRKTYQVILGVLWPFCSPCVIQLASEDKLSISISRVGHYMREGYGTVVVSCISHIIFDCKDQTSTSALYMIPVSGFLPPPTPPQCDDPVHTTHCSNDYMAAALLL